MAKKGKLLIGINLNLITQRSMGTSERVEEALTSKDFPKVEVRNLALSNSSYQVPTFSREPKAMVTSSYSSLIPDIEDRFHAPSQSGLYLSREEGSNIYLLILYNWP